MLAPPDPLAPDLGRKAFHGAVLGLLLVHGVMLIALAALLPWTTDEYAYLKAGTILRLDRAWEVPQTTFHGPLPFFANQLAAWLGVAPVEPTDDYLFFGRLGMLPFALLAAGTLTWLTRRLFDRRTALFALLLHAANPVVLANAPLMTCDMAMASFYVLTISLAHGLLRAPSVWRWFALAIALGAALATKYLALFLLPVLGLTLLFALGFGYRPKFLLTRTHGGAARIAGDVALASIVVAAVALLTLHTCYLWAADNYTPPTAAADATAANHGPRSALFTKALTLPLVPDALRLLPEPFVRGVDFQKMQSEAAGLTPFFARIAPGHSAYFAVSMLVKLPLALLLLMLCGVAAGARWPSRARSLLVFAIGVPFVYLSFFSVLQNGIRNLLPTVVLLCVVAARGAAWLNARGRVSRGLLAALCVTLVICHAITWPRYPNAFNVLAGDRPYLIFADANFDWSARLPPDLVTMRRRHPSATAANGSTGPTFGTFLVNGGSLARPDPRANGQLYHWLRRLHPTERLGAWCLFAVDEAAFAAADLAFAPRSRVELAVAHFGDEQPEAALRALADNDDPDAARVRALAQAMQRGEARAPSFWQTLLDLGRHDLVVAPTTSATPLQRATAHWTLGEMAKARQILDDVAATRPLSPVELNVLLSALVGLGEFDTALLTLDRNAPAADAPERAVFDWLRNHLVQEIRAWQTLRDR